MSTDPTRSDRADQNQGFLTDRVGSDRIGSDRIGSGPIGSDRLDLQAHTALAPINWERVPINRGS